MSPGRKSRRRRRLSISNLFVSFKGNVSSSSGFLSSLGFRRWRLIGAVAVFAAVFAAVAPAAAATLTWNGGGTTVTGPVDGPGTWDTGTNWWSSGAAAVWSNSSDAVFGASSGTAGTVTIGNVVSPNSITFNPAASGNYTIAGGNIGVDANPGGSLPITVNASTATIASSFTGLGGLTKNGIGTLTLNGNSTYAGNTLIAGGTLRLANASQQNLPGDDRRLHR